MKLDYIDALRGIAILSVIWFHCHLHHYSNTTYFSLMDTLGSPAAMGVQLFYVLSAFTLFLSQGRHKSGSEENANFFTRRFFRIAPMYYVAIVYYVWQMTYMYGQSTASILASNTYGIITNSLLLHGLSPVWINSIIPGGWSVGIEILFYAMVPFLSTRITTLNRAVFFTAFTLLFGYILTSFLSQASFIQSNELLTQYMFFYLPYQLPVFGFGIAAYYIVIKNDYRISSFVMSLALSVVVIIFLFKTIGRTHYPNLPHTLHFLESFGFTLLIIGLSKFPVSIIVNRITRHVGKVSYSAYLTHFGILYWMDRFLPHQFIPVNSALTNVLNFNLNFLLIVCLTVFISTSTYHFIEVPAQQYGKRFLRKSIPEPAYNNITS